MLIRLRDEDFSGAKSEEGEVAGRHDTCRQKDHKDAKLFDGKPPSHSQQHLDRAMQILLNMDPHIYRRQAMSDDLKSVVTEA